MDRLELNPSKVKLLNKDHPEDCDKCCKLHADSITLYDICGKIYKMMRKGCCCNIVDLKSKKEKLVELEELISRMKKILELNDN